MERQACEIRLRAERRAGQLLAEMEKAKGSPGNQHTGPVERADRSKTLPELGISRDQSSQWQKLAKIPEEEFEEAVRAERPSTSGIIAASAPRPEPKKNAVDDHALWLWGRLNDIERDGLLDEDPNELVGQMLPHMQATTRDIASVRTGSRPSHVPPSPAQTDPASRHQPARAGPPPSRGARPRRHSRRAPATARASRARSLQLRRRLRPRRDRADQRRSCVAMPPGPAPAAPP